MSDETRNVSEIPASPIVPSVGIEPTRPFGQRILSPTCQTLNDVSNSTVTGDSASDASQTDSAQRPTFTYFIQGETGGNIKIGKAVDVQQRLRSHQCSSGVPLRVVGVIEGDCESDLHRQFAALRKHGEWFAPAPELLRFIRERTGCQAALGYASTSPVFYARERSMDFCGGDVDWVDKSDLLSVVKKHIEDTKEEDNCRRTNETPRRRSSSGCECAVCEVTQVARQLSQINHVVGFCWRDSQSMLAAVAIRPKLASTADRFLQYVINRFDGFDRVGISLNLIWIEHNGAAVDANLFSAWIDDVTRNADEDEDRVAWSRLTEGDESEPTRSESPRPSADRRVG